MLPSTGPSSCDRASCVAYLSMLSLGLDVRSAPACAYLALRRTLARSCSRRSVRTCLSSGPAALQLAATGAQQEGAKRAVDLSGDEYPRLSLLEQWASWLRAVAEMQLRASMWAAADAVLRRSA